METMSYKSGRAPCVTEARGEGTDVLKEKILLSKAIFRRLISFVFFNNLFFFIGASEPKHMAYMVRLGIWGPGSPFRDFNDFLGAVEKRGVGAMEIVAMDMKLRGMYIARQLSFQVFFFFAS